MRPPESWASSRLTMGLAIVTAAAWLLASSLGIENDVIAWGGFIPARVDGLIAGAGFAPAWLTPLTATFIHAGIIHLGFNLLILVFCGRPVETILGMGAMATLYVVGAYAAAAAHYLTNPGDTVPMIGASGAISAVLGAYAMLFGRNKVRVADPGLALWLNALWLLAAWIVLQLVVGITFATMGAQIAIAAHIGGFLVGLLLARPLLLFRYRNA
jgi:membrane associated rhomboid family serine protease